MQRRPSPEMLGFNPDATRSSLVRRLGNWGDDGGWQEFFDRYWRLIYAIATKAGLSDCEAQDVVQETVLSVAKTMRAGGYDRTRSSFKTFIYTVTRRRIIDHFRRRNPARTAGPFESEEEPGLDNGGGDSSGASFDLSEAWEEEWHKNLLQGAIERVKEKVSPKQFQIFDLSVLRELPVSEVAKLLKTSAAQVYLARHRVSALVKKEFTQLQKTSE